MVTCIYTNQKHQSIINRRLHQNINQNTNKEKMSQTSRIFPSENESRRKKKQKNT